MTAAFVATRDIFTRKIPAELSSIHITLATVMLVTLAGLLLSFFDWREVEFSNVMGISGLCYTA